MVQNKIENDYFRWLYDLVCEGRYAKEISYRKLLMHLHNTKFRYCVQNDKNRASDGVSLRHRFAWLLGSKYLADNITNILTGECSVLEMLIALSIRCEENIMDDPSKGDRTGQWFWSMIVNLGLGAMIDSKYDKCKVDEIMERLLDRKYEPNGKGGLFTIRNCNQDLREVEIWYQLCWYLDDIT